MNSLMILAFSEVLFVMGCAPPDAHAADQCCNCISSQQRNNNEYISMICLELHNELCDKERSRVPHRHQYIDCEEECSCKLLEEIVKNETERQKSQDRQADILEKLLLE
jgi:hypothetical protein